MFTHSHSFAGFVSIKFWLQCWKPMESLLGTSGTTAKCQTTNVSFHQVCEAVKIICLNLLWEITVYFTMKKMKCSQIYEHGLDLKQKKFYFESVDTDTSLFSLIIMSFLLHNNAKLTRSKVIIYLLFSHDHQLISGTKCAVLIGTRANKDCVTSPTEG